MADESSNGVYAEWACELTASYRAKPNSSVVRSPNRIQLWNALRYRLQGDALGRSNKRDNAGHFYY
jgi:hypothetical protein